MTFTVTHVQRGEIVRLHLAGELDLGTVSQLNTAVDDLVDAGLHRIVVELRELTFCDSTGLAAFVRGDNRCVAAGGWLRLTGATGSVARVLRVSGLDDVLRDGGDRGDHDDPTAVPDPA